VIESNEEKNEARRIGARNFFVDDFLFGQRTPAARPALWPMRRGIAGRNEFVEPVALRSNECVLIRTRHGLAPVLRNVFIQPDASLFAQVIGINSTVH
jgi:hypothetical protein